MKSSFPKSVQSAQLSLTIINKLGLHARAAAKFVKAAQLYKSEIMVSKGHLKANGKSIMGLLTLAAEKGSVIKVNCMGPDQDRALLDLKQLVEAGFGE